METFQHFNKQLRTLLHPSWLQDSRPPCPTYDWCLRNWPGDSLFLCCLRLHFPPFFFTRGKNRQRAVGGGVTVLSTASLRKSSFSAGNGELKCHSRALWKCLLWTRRGVEAGLDDPSTSFLPFALPRPQLVLLRCFPSSTLSPHSLIGIASSTAGGERGWATEGRRGGVNAATKALRSLAGFPSSYTMHENYSCL